MYPKSPFSPEAKEKICTPCVDDNLLNFNERKIVCAIGREKLVKIKLTIKRLNENLYNLKHADKCNHNANESRRMRQVMTRFLELKTRLRREARNIVEQNHKKKEQNLTKYSRTRCRFTP